MIKDKSLKQLCMWMLASGVGMIIAHTNIVIDTVLIFVGIGLFIKLDGGIK